MGKEIIITEELVSEICGHIRMGAGVEVSARACGLPEDQLPIIMGLLLEAEEGFYKEFADDIKKAMSQFEVMQLMKINTEGGANGARWLLERTMPNKWGIPEKGKKSTHPQNPLQITDEPVFTMEFEEFK